MALRSDLHDNELVAVKDGHPPDELRREAALLEDLAHPGVIRFVALTEGGQGPRLLTRYAGRETLATWQPNRLDELARVFVELAEAVEYLHTRGVTHRSIRPAHVIIDAQRRPLLCGFSGARRSGGTDPADARPADVTAIGTTLQSVLDGVEERAQRTGRRREDQRLRERLRSAAQAAADGRVPSARALAGQIQALQGGASDRQPAGTGTGGEPLPLRRSGEILERLRVSPMARPRAPRRRLAGRPEARGRDPRVTLRRAQRGRRRPRRATVIAAVAVCAGCALGALMVTRLDGDRAAPLAPATAGTLDGAAAPPAVPDPGPAVPAGPASTGITTGADSCRPPARGYRDITGDGCAEEVVIDSASVLVDGARYPVGEAGDQVAVGDWDCDGIATVALAQSGGRVYLFGGWPEDAPLVGELVAELMPPVQLADVPRGACNELVVQYAGGTWHLPLGDPPG